MTEYLFRDDAYLAEADGDRDRRRPRGDRARPHDLLRQLRRPARRHRPAASAAARSRSPATVHPGRRPRAGPAPASPAMRLAGAGRRRSGCALDWERRYRLMRMHSALHLLSVVLPYGVTGGSIGEDKGRLDFDMPEPPEDVAALEARLNALRRRRPAGRRRVDHRGRARGAARDGEDDEGQAAGRPGPGAAGADRRGRRRPSTCSPAAARTCARPPRSGRSGIGKIEKKGRENRRVNLHFAD